MFWVELYQILGKKYKEEAEMNKCLEFALY